MLVFDTHQCEAIQTILVHWASLGIFYSLSLGCREAPKSARPVAYATDYETLGTLRLRWDERTQAGWRAGVKTRMQLYADQQVCEAH